MFSETGRVICRKCSRSMRIELIEPITPGSSKLTFRCFYCEARRALVTGQSPCEVNTGEVSTEQKRAWELRGT